MRRNKANHNNERTRGRSARDVAAKHAPLGAAAATGARACAGAFAESRLLTRAPPRPRGARAMSTDALAASEGRNRELAEYISKLEGKLLTGAAPSQQRARVSALKEQLRESKRDVETLERRLDASEAERERLHRAIEVLEGAAGGASAALRSVQRSPGRSGGATVGGGAGGGSALAVGNAIAAAGLSQRPGGSPGGGGSGRKVRSPCAIGRPFAPASAARAAPPAPC